MKKQILSIIMAIIMAVGLLPVVTVEVSANPAGSYSGYGWSYSAGTLTITSNTGTTAWRDNRSTATFTISQVTSVLISLGVNSPPLCGENESA